MPGADSRTAGVTRGVARLLEDLGCEWLAEFKLATGRRVDLIGLDRRGAFTIVEVKTSLADYRGDTKWREYLAWCDRFYFAVPPSFPRGVMPRDQGLIVGDSFEAAIVRPAESSALHANRRKAMVLRFARVAARRLAAGQNDQKEPDPEGPG
jgi:hypothetical protein